MVVLSRIRVLEFFNLACSFLFILHLCSHHTSSLLYLGALLSACDSKCSQRSFFAHHLHVKKSWQDFARIINPSSFNKRIEHLQHVVTIHFCSHRFGDLETILAPQWDAPGPPINPSCFCQERLLSVLPCQGIIALPLLPFSQ